MTVFRPCIGCGDRVGCPIKLGVSKALRGQQVTSARLRCDIPFAQHFPPGTRVLVKVWDHRDFDGDEILGKLVPASVVCRSTKKRDKALMLLDQKIMLGDDKEIEFCTAYPKDLTKLDEPLAPVCEDCGRLLVHGTCGAHDNDDRGY